jgi:hypothetical protein
MIEQRIKEVLQQLTALGLGGKASRILARRLSNKTKLRRLRSALRIALAK